MLVVIWSKDCTGPDTAALMSFFMLCSQHLLSLHKYFTGSSCSSLAEWESAGLTLSYLSFPGVCRIFSVCLPERLEFSSSSLFKLHLSLWQRFRGGISPKCVTGAWDAEFHMLPFHFVSYGRGKWKWKSYILVTMGHGPKWGDEVMWLILIQTTAKNIAKGESSVSCYCLHAGVLCCDLLLNLQCCKAYF